MSFKRPLLIAKGFTLAELLIALGILGVIATFTIPKILISQNGAKRVAVFKEVIATLNVVLQQGRLEGVVTDSNLGTYYLNHLNAIKICSTNAVSQGCWSPDVTDIASQQAAPGVTLANGAFIAGLDDASSGTGADTIIIDWNGMDEPNVQGEDVMVIRAFLDDTSTTDRVGTVRGDSSYPTSLTMFRQIFQQ